MRRTRTPGQCRNSKVTRAEAEILQAINETMREGYPLCLGGTILEPTPELAKATLAILSNGMNTEPEDLARSFSDACREAREGKKGGAE